MTTNNPVWIQGERYTVSALSEYVADFTGWNATLEIKRKPTSAEVFVRQSNFELSEDKQSLTTDVRQGETAAIPLGENWLIIKMQNPASTITIESRQQITVEPAPKSPLEE